ncbi:MAG: CofH family radical SAM protein [Fibrobacter sp.]|nr:CofH family radical SAM protein [Fibrobacter sp.]
MHPILQKALQGKRLTSDDALEIWENIPWTQVVEAGHTRRLQLLPKLEVSFTAYRLINYTNVCDVNCSFCSFKNEVNSKQAYVLSLEEIKSKALEAKKQGANQIMFQGGVHTGIELQYHLDALNLLHHDLGMHVRGYSPIELWRYAQHWQMPLKDLLELLKKAGLGSVPGAGAEILSESMRKKLSPHKLSAELWCQVMGECHKAGLEGSANIVFGSDESSADIIEHLNAIRTQQDATGGFNSFVAWKFQAQTKDFYLRHIRGDEYLKMVALCRLFLDNIKHIEASILVMGPELGEMALYSGANDINSFVIEENVLRSRGLRSKQAAINFIQRAGFKSLYRDFNFNSFSPV